MLLRLLLILLLAVPALAQKKYVAITMDDNPFLTMPAHYTSEQCEQTNGRLLSRITATKVPVAAFLCGQGSFMNNEVDKRLRIMKQWIDNPYVTVGNHTYSHPNYVTTPSEVFKEEIITNEFLIKQLNESKAIKYFRFPYNGLGADSIQHKQIQDYLEQKGYIAAPFTVESTDYMYNALYVKAQKEGNAEKAKAVANAYLQFTVESFRYFEKLSQQIHGRNISQIFLCHGNPLAADYFEQLVDVLKREGYEFVSLDKAMEDPVYKSTSYYTGKEGFSWMYRWIKDPKIRVQHLRTSPDPDMALWEEFKALN
ncbi:polysaccharide deacetylase family protein [Telluribacter sp. SYSU D00476]|uniref:polysaccharide deacetylase family protein n=1 Tax=Telluribacter sp. SYSU D00476 TaxID=2811430 RepID=UPI001FF6A627|nr:polysaccharide deacetylase family protein [Telluribacter sp. SYSU D00476]